MILKPLVIFIALLGSLYTLVLNIVRMRAINNPIPENVSDVYDADTYLKWKKYSYEHSRLDICTTVISCLIMFFLLISNAYSVFASYFPNDEFSQLTAIIIVEITVTFIVDTIHSYISTMKIEQKYGFNKSSIKTFIADSVRSLIINACLSFAIVFLMMFAHKLLGDMLIVVFIAVLFVFTLIITFLYPVLSRIGNKFVPLEDGELRSRLLKLLSNHGYQVKDIMVMDASRRTTKLNAYFTGFGKIKRIVLYDNLVKSMSTDEICAVFAHELGHGLNKDVIKQNVMNIFNLVIMALWVWFSLREPALHVSFGFIDINYGFAYVLVGIFMNITNPVSSLYMNAYSRYAEYRADKQAVKEGYGTHMIFALKKLAKDNFSNLSPSKLNVVLEYSHPPLSDRIRRIEETEAIE